MSKIDTKNRPPSREEVRVYILAMVEELGGLAHAHGHVELGDALRKVEHRMTADPALVEGHV
jgi:hypothetical protein